MPKPALRNAQRLRERAAAAGERSRRAAWVDDLAAVLDDEPPLVLDPDARRGHALTMRGIGDNAQLHILLADRLVGDPAAGVGRAAVRAFRLFDGHGRSLGAEGRFAGIQPLDGTRVLVLHAPNGRYAMGAARVSNAMRPTLTPAVQDDLMAPRRP